MDPQALAALRDELGGILFGALFVYFGMAACAVAAALPRRLQSALPGVDAVPGTGFRRR